MPLSRPLALLLTLTSGCAYISDDDAAWRLDPDGDGVKIGQDCDDGDGAVGASVTFYLDTDGDGYGDAATEETGCAVPDDAVLNADDCDDAAPDTYPGAPDEWYDGVDADCAGNDDDDQDGDGYGVDTDCDDTDPSLAPDPSIDEVYFNGVDDNCDLSDADGDQDGDGYWAWDYVNRCNAASAVPLEIPDGQDGDCWDDPSTVRAGFDAINGFAALEAAAVNPAATEVWYDGVDQDCAGVDSNDDDVPDDFDWDLDGDPSLTWPDRAGTTGGDCLDCDCTPGDCPEACSDEIDNPAGLEPSSVNRNATETFYDGTDQDCRGDDDLDRDGDGFECAPSYGGLCAGDDCDDERRSVYPGAPDAWYDGLDSDCGGEDDFDQDGDGYSAIEYGGSDCDDVDSTVSPAATEVWYDGLDQDCDGWNDFDQDYDGYRSEAEWSTGTDCDDTNSAANPGQSEIEGNGFDDDCSGDSNGNLIEGNVSASGAEARWVGAVASDAAGRTVAPAGDVDGDGAADFLVGAPSHDSYGSSSGAVYLVPGNESGANSLSSSDATLYGSGTSDQLGYGLAGVGDQNGDGYDDFAMSAYGDSVSSSNDGAVFVVLGPLSSTSTASSAADGLYWGAYTNSQAGRVLADGGDHDSDGVTELLVAAPYDDWDGTNAGRVWLVQGPLTGVSSMGSHVEISPESGDGEALGSAILSADLTGDGQADLAIGAENFNVGSLSAAGAVYVEQGPVTADVTVGLSSTARLLGDAEFSGLGAAIAAADVNDDGYEDLLLGAPYGTFDGTTYAGVVYVIAGPVTSSGAASTVATATIGGPTSNTSFGSALSAGDLDGDGVGDLVIGEEHGSRAAGYSGRSWFLHGPISGSQAVDARSAGLRYGDTSYDYFGHSVSVFGDGDGDGYDDVVVSAPGEDLGTTNAGAVFLFRGGAL
jgi:hypothetical protein